MDFTLNTEQEMLRESARRFIQAYGSSPQGTPDPQQELELWSKLVDMGWTAIAVPESAGGFGSSIEDMAVLFLETGRGLLNQPLLISSVLASCILRQCQTAGAQQVLQEIAEGQAIVSVATYEPGLRYELFDLDTLACETGNGYHINGKKMLVPGGVLSNRIIFTARLASTGELGIFIAPADSPGLHRSHYHLFDGSKACDLSFKNLQLPYDALLGGPYSTAEILENALDEILLMLCAETIGAMEESIHLTVDYLKVREQFGTPLANFQALQHQVADMFIATTHAKSSLYQGIAGHAQGKTDNRKNVSGCLINIMNQATKVIGTAIHLHGGIGFTCEHQVGHLYRKVLVNGRLYGNIDHHMARYKALQEFTLLSDHEGDVDKVCLKT